MRKYLKYNWHLSPRDPFRVQVQYFPEAARYPVLDVHPSMHLQWVAEGNFQGRIGDQILLFPQGEILLISPNEIHGENRIAGGLKLLAVTVESNSLLNALLLPPERLQAVFMLPVQKRMKLLNHEELRGKLQPFFRKLLESGKEASDVEKMRQWLLIQQIFTEIVDCAGTDEVPGNDFQKLAPALAKLNSGENCTLAQAAACCGISPGYFSHLFRRTYYTPYSTYLLHLRLNRAAVLLQNGASVKTAAESECFWDTSYFVKCFTRKYGMSPGKWARSQK